MYFYYLYLLHFYHFINIVNYNMCIYKKCINKSIGMNFSYLYNLNSVIKNLEVAENEDDSER